MLDGWDLMLVGGHELLVGCVLRDLFPGTG